jgi:hypothetical protein
VVDADVHLLDRNQIDDGVLVRLPKFINVLTGA